MLKWTNFSAPLIDPSDPDKSKDPEGMHLWARAKINMPLVRKAKKFAEISLVLTAGFYAELVSGNKKTSDIAYFIETLGDIEGT